MDPDDRRARSDPPAPRGRGNQPSRDTSGAIYEMVGRCAPAGSVTEAFGWVTTANCPGASVGAAVAGQAVESLAATVA
jgi:methylthioribose-1-phosphate isomerase